jgi:Na+/H+-dicarboxylate symporter
MKSTLLVLGALVAGILLGGLIAAAESPALQWIASVIEPLGVIWVNAIRMTVIPLVFSILVAAVASRRDPRAVGRLGVRAILAFSVFLFAGGIFAMLAAPPLLEGLEIDPEAGFALRESARGSAAAVAESARKVPSLRDRLVGIVPVNVVSAAAEGAILPVVVFGLLFALAIGRLAPDSRERLVGFLDALGQAMLVLVKWVLALAPVGIFALSLGLASDMGFAAAGAIARYVLVLSALLVAYTLALYPAVVLISGVSPGRFAAACAPAQAVAASTRSSLAALPSMLAAVRERLGLDTETSGFLLPLAVSVFRVNVPIAWVVGALFLGRLYGVDLDTGTLLSLLATSVALSFSVPGLPSASLYLLAPVLAGLGLPAEGVGILIAVDALPDVFKTTANVTSHLGAVTMLARSRS